MKFGISLLGALILLSGCDQMDKDTSSDVAIAAPEKQAVNDGRGDRVVGGSWATRSTVLGRNGMAATSHPLASQIAIDILKAGGNAVDAAIAGNAALGLMEPMSNGIGGDFFIIMWDPKTERLYGLNGSGRAPMGQTFADLKERLGPDAKHIPFQGSLSVSVPGTVDGWFTLHERFGTMPMADILAPTIDYANDGFPVTQVVAAGFQGAINSLEELHTDGILEEIDNYKATYLIDGEPPVEGQVFRNPDLAGTLTRIAEGGRDAFYKGDVARTIDAYMKRIGGPLRYEDFAAHTSEWIDPVSVNYRGYDVWELPPNGQGIAALQMLNIMEGFDVAAMDHNSAEYLHIMVETKKLVYEDRARHYADMAFADVPVERLLSKEYAAKRRALIDHEKARMEFEAGDMMLAEGDTIYMTVADKDGMMVSLIQSVNSSMGSGLVADGLGFALQNRGRMLSLEEDHANVYAPGKRPFNTIIPAFMTRDGVPLMSFGLMGGAVQPQGHTQIVLNLIDFGMGLQEAGDIARWRHVRSTSPYILDSKMTDGGTLLIESGIAGDVADQLRGRGHTVEYARGPFGGYQAIWRDPETGVYWGASEMRKDGMAIGY